MGNESGIVVVGNDNTGDAFCAAIDMESVVCKCQLHIWWK
jgi:hypothetical protein